MATPRWEHFEHQADVGVRGFGRTVEEAFENAALALTAVLVEPQDVLPEWRAEVTCSATDRELLLVAWLNTVVYEMAVRRAVFSHFKVHIGVDGRLTATLSGEHLDPARHQPVVEVKGATCTALSVTSREGVWTAQCVVDV